MFYYKKFSQVHYIMYYSSFISARFLDKCGSRWNEELVSVYEEEIQQS